MICKNCNAVFPVCDADTIRDETGRWLACPECGSDQLDEEALCRDCSSPTARAELDNGLCAVCAEETELCVRWFVDMLTDAQLDWLCKHMELLERRKTDASTS